MKAPIVIVTGPPGAGKTTLSLYLAQSLPRSVHIPVDDIREWVIGGLAQSFDWTDETERQFQISEKVACDTAKTYAEEGFVSLIDHCRNLPRLNEMCNQHLQGQDVIKVLLLPDLEVNVIRNRARQDKSFDPLLLEKTVIGTQKSYREQDQTGWIVLSESEKTTEELGDKVLTNFQT